MIIDGKEIASDILARAKARAEKLSHRPRVVAYAPEVTPATKSYLKIKQKYGNEAGCDFVVSEELSFADADAAIIQLPLPSGVEKEVLSAIPVSKDADVLSSSARTLFEKREEGYLLPPVVGAVQEILKQVQYDLKGKRAVVLGDGFLVGMPVKTWFAQEGADVTVVTRDTRDITSVLTSADILVSGIGVAHFIKPEMLKEGVVLIDAGTSESSGVLVGDADPLCEKKCSLFTPVPGGVGPVAVACLFENAVTLAERAIHH